MNPSQVIFHGDNLRVMEGLESEQFQLIYADPPFNSGKDYGAFDDRFGGPVTPRDLGKYLAGERSHEYIMFMESRLFEMRRLLTEDGSLFLHCDHSSGHYLKVILDNIFGGSDFRGEIVWHYQSSGGAPKTWPNRNHDKLLAYAKDKRKAKWNQPREPWPAATLAKWQTDDKGIYRTNNGVRYYINPDGKLADDVWEIPFTGRTAERVGYPTQKPLALLERIITAATDEGDRVLDPFCGSGTTLVACERLGRVVVGIDSSERAIATSKARLA